MAKRKTEKKSPHKNHKKNTKNAKKTKKFRELKCGPKKKYNFSCYSSQSLNKLKELWNKRHPDAKITTNNPREIWTKLKENLKTVCNTEKCWLNQNFVKTQLNAELKNFTFAPQSPPTWKKNPNEWLNSLDIKKKVFGQCVWNDLCNFNLEAYIKKGKNKIGIIFNTDPHHLDGSHWICMFINIKEQYIFFFDSNADKTPPEINKFVNKIKKQGKPLGIEFKYHRNTRQHQKTDTECGIYVLYVITQLITNKMTPTMFNERRIPDKDMIRLRKVFFN